MFVNWRPDIFHNLMVHGHHLMGALAYFFYFRMFGEFLS